ncbi:MAG: outer membrane protein assembly factor BamB [Candidatus Paceibacteria bacterium]|jgi:outer membrane protein assembly factor BamB
MFRWYGRPRTALRRITRADVHSMLLKMYKEGMSISTILLTCALAMVPGEDDGSQEGNWPSFRGFRARGIADTHALPVDWNVEQGNNVLWKTSLPGLAHSSPIIWGDKVFVTTAVRMEAEANLSSLYGSAGYGAGESVENEGAHAFLLLCMDKNSGELLWEKTASEVIPEIKRHPKSSHANPTPAVDADHVVAFFGSDGIFCYDHEGELKWEKDFGVLDTGAPGMEDYEQFQWGFASSPVLYDGKLIVQCDIQEQSFLVVLDVATGKEVWRIERDEDSGWGTPTVHEVAACDGPQIILNGYKHIGGYELATGKEIWKLVGGGDVPVPTPIVEHGLIYITSAHGPLRPIYAIDAETAQGELSMDPTECEAMAWSNRRGIYMQTLLVYGEELYACSDGGVLQCFDAVTGESHYRQRIGDGRSGFSSSAVGGDGKVYFAGEAGMVHVVQAGSEYSLLASNDMGETIMSTPAISEGRLYVRTRGSLVCIGEE